MNINTDDVIAEYLRLRKPDGVSVEEIIELEHRIDLHLPDNMKQIAMVFRGGRLGEIDFFCFAADGPQSIGGETMRFRRDHGLPSHIFMVGRLRRFIFAYDTKAFLSVFAHPESLIRDTGCDPGKLDKEDRLDLHFYNSYSAFFRHQVLGEQYKSVQKAFRKHFHNLVQARAREWRHRFLDADENRRIRESLNAGNPRRVKLGTVIHDGQDYVDLRGFGGELANVNASNRRPDDPDSKIHVRNAPTLEFIDFSFASANWWTMKARHCLFDAAAFSVVHGSYTDCSFRMVHMPGGSLYGDYTRCRFVGAKLEGCSLGFDAGTFLECDFTGADLAKTEPGARFVRCNFTDCRFGADEFGCWARALREN